MSGIKVEGIEKLEKQLRENITLNDVKKVVRHNGVKLQKKIQRNADFKKGYQTGTTKRSVGEAGLVFSDGGLTVESGATTEYAEYVELGTRFMDAQPFAKPALDEQEPEFKSDMQKLVK